LILCIERVGAHVPAVGLDLLTRATDGTTSDEGQLAAHNFFRMTPGPLSDGLLGADEKSDGGGPL